jgi:hypothetical protein
MRSPYHFIDRNLPLQKFRFYGFMLFLADWPISILNTLLRFKLPATPPSPLIFRFYSFAVFTFVNLRFSKLQPHILINAHV